MKQRNPLAVLLITFVTLGIYGLVWEVKTKNEMNALGADIPTAWLLIIPVANIYWLWKYCGGVEKVTGGKLSQILAFVLFFLLGIIGAAIIQNEFNKVGSTVASPADTAAPLSADPLPAGPNPYQPVTPQQPTIAATSPQVIAPASIDPTTSQPADVVPPSIPSQV